MLWKLLLFPVAFVIERIFIYIVYGFLWPYIGLRIEMYISHAWVLLIKRWDFLGNLWMISSRIFQTCFFQFFSSVGAIILLALWGHKFSFVVYLIFIFFRELYIIRHTSVANRTGNYIFKYGALIGLLVALGLLSFIAAMIK